MRIIWSALTFINDRISQSADELSAKCWDSRTALFGLQILALLLIIVPTISCLLYLGIIEGAESSKTWLMIRAYFLFVGPLWMWWGIHLLRHASWRFQQAVDRGIEN